MPSEVFLLLLPWAHDSTGWRYAEVYQSDPSKPDYIPDSHTQEKTLQSLLQNQDIPFLPDAYPDFTFSIQNSFSYKNFDLSFLFRGSVGNDVLNMSRLYYEGFSYFGSNNILKSTLEHPEYKGGAIYSSRFIEDGSFVKLDNLTLGYNVPLKGKVISKMRIYVTGQNLLTLTKYKGMDPEVHLAGLEPGIEWYTFYPRTKTYLLGLNITF